MAGPSWKQKSTILRKAVTEPVDSPTKVWPYWDCTLTVYRAYVVKVLARKGDLLSFAVWDGQSVLTRAKGKAYSVDLTDGAVAWGDLPSTAQRARPDGKKVWGLLFLSDHWAERNLGRELLVFANGNKFPTIAGL